MLKPGYPLGIGKMVSSNWNIEGLQEKESVLLVARICGGSSMTHRIVLTDRRVLTMKSPFWLHRIGRARLVSSKILTSVPLTEVAFTAFVSKFYFEAGGRAGRYNTLHILTVDGNRRTYESQGRRSALRRVADALEDRIGG
jgi:hypothetical protein